MGIGVNESWMRQNRDAMRNFFKGYLEGWRSAGEDQGTLCVLSAGSPASMTEILLELPYQHSLYPGKPM
jgi:hypothetical protein